MDKSSMSLDEVVMDFSPFFRVYKDGRVEKLKVTTTVPPSVDPKTGVESKDVVFMPENGVSARLYIPKITTDDPADQKLPLLVYFHGGGFCIESAFSPTYHNYLNALVSKASIVAMSVDYRKAPEHLLPTAFEDSWAALQWVASHSNRKGPEPWLNNHVNFQRVFLAGDSAGGNIAHNMAMWAGAGELTGVTIEGIILVDAAFSGKEPIGTEAIDVVRKKDADSWWHFICPATSGCDDPLLNPAADPKLSSLGCTRVLVCVAEKDILRARGWYYHETLGKSGWKGVVEIMETEGENHVFHLLNPTSEKAETRMNRFASFMNQAKAH